MGVADADFGILLSLLIYLRCLRSVKQGNDAGVLIAPAS